MKKLPLLFLLIFTIISACSSKKMFISDKLELKWETTGFDTPECVCYDEVNNVYYVSNVAGNPSEKDGIGFISVLNTDGSIKALKWVEGLNAPKGMTLVDDMLFVSDIDEIVKIDVNSGSIVSKNPIEGSAFLNDIASDTAGVIYISDSQTKTYYSIDSGMVSILLSDSSFGSPNGIIYDDGVLVSGTGNNVIKIDILSGAYSSFIENTGGVDALQKITDNSFLISDWTGKVHLIYTDKEKELVLDSTPLEAVNAADICYNKKEGTILVPTFFGNTVACYKLKL
ncbi:MAG: hypothetical protein JXA77_17970 [Bacteroidales bacterium]|nr:hypothetical protein [Bacteroidales bacterium]MBN2818072.1 hypothetical protein [Bacteroidales bacterium]